MAKSRDYRAEYERRLARASERGLSRSQARGHARSGETSVRRKPIMSDDRLEAALKLLRQTGNQGAAAKAARIAPERFRRFLSQNSLADRAGRTWKITDNRARYMTVLTSGESKDLKFLGFAQASVNGKHLAAVRSFLSSNDIGYLRPFIGRSVIDSKGKTHTLETDPNRLHRIASARDSVFHDIYRLVLTGD